MLKFYFALSLLFCNVLVAQQIDLYLESSFPARPAGGIDQVNYLIEEQIVYPQKEFEENTSAEIFVFVLVSADAKIDSVWSELPSSNVFAKEAIRLTKLIRWKAEDIRKQNKIEFQRIKFTFSPKKYKKILKKRKVQPTPSSESALFTISAVDSVPTIQSFGDINEFVSENIKYPGLALQQGISGQVKVKFIIEANGRVSMVEIIKPLAGGCNEETIRLLRKTIWNPGIKNNREVRTLMDYTLNFVHPGNNYYR